MLIKFKSVRELIQHICDELPSAANDDRILYTAYWKHQDPSLSDETLDRILKLTSSETITRGRRSLEEVGKIKVDPNVRMRRTERQAIIQNTVLTEKEQEVLSMKPTEYEPYQKNGSWYMRKI